MEGGEIGLESGVEGGGNWVAVEEGEGLEVEVVPLVD